jgi:LuxR family quorum sensing-dependent transcriptional regulator
MIDKAVPDLTQLSLAATPEAAVALFLSALPGWGFDAAAAGGWAGVPGAQAHRFYFSTWPEGWGRLYAEANLFPRDPVVALARRRSRPFLLTEEAEAMREDAGAVEVIAMTQAFGWAEVLAVPIHGPAGYQGLVALASFRPVAPDAAARAQIAACAREVHDRCHDAPGFGARVPSAPGLKPRQMEVLRLVARGLTDKEIGRALGLSPATAHYHVEAAKRVLGVRTRAEVVAICALDGLL